jgi:hypothetical protein
MRPEVEQLSPRDCPGGPGVSIDCTGLVTIRGTPGPDRVRIDVGADLVRVRIGRLWWGFDPAEVTGYRVMGGGGRDLVEWRFALEEGSGAEMDRTGSTETADFGPG